jgi:hypothetical protein
LPILTPTAGLVVNRIALVVKLRLCCYVIRHGPDY